MAEEKESGREGIREGLRQGLGVLSAFKEAIEETISEARERGDLSPERAKEIMRTAMRRAQEAADHARERFDFVPRRDFEVLRAELAALKDRVAALEQSVGAGAAAAEGDAPPSGEPLSGAAGAADEPVT